MSELTLRAPQSLLALVLFGAIGGCNTNKTVGANDGQTAAGGAGGNAATASQSTSSGSTTTTTGATTTTTGTAAGGSGTGGAGGGTGAGGGAGGAPDACNALTEKGTSYAFSSQPPPAPAASGGTIADGVYVISSNVAYTNIHVGEAGQVPGGFTMVIAGNTMNRVISKVHQTYQLSTSGTDLTRLTLCDSETPSAVGTSSTFGYTATADELSEFLPWDFGQGLEMQIFTWKRLP